MLIKGLILYICNSHYLHLSTQTSTNLFIHACVVPGLVEGRMLNVKHSHMDKLIYHLLTPPFFWLHEQLFPHQSLMIQLYQGDICSI